MSKDCVMNVDRKTKTVLKSWPLEQLRRWTASPFTFNIVSSRISCHCYHYTLQWTLQDFGDYVDGYYSVQTPEGEKIKKLIGDYVDIILKVAFAKLIVGELFNAVHTLRSPKLLTRWD